MKNKPLDMKYTDLCIYIDNTVYERNDQNEPIALRTMTEKEAETVYNYIYNLVYALAVKKKLMVNYSDYADFCIGVSGIIFQRLTKPDQCFDLTNKTAKNKCIQSVLNYIKSCLAFMANDFRAENYAQIISSEYYTQEELENVKEYIINTIIEQYRPQEREDICDTFSAINTYITQELDQSIYKKNKIALHSLYMSILLSFLNTFTITAKEKKFKDKRLENVLLEQIQNKEQNIICWDDNTDITKQVVSLYVKKILSSLQVDIDDIQATAIPPEDILKDIALSALPTYGLNQKEDIE